MKPSWEKKQASRCQLMRHACAKLQEAASEGASGDGVPGVLLVADGHQRAVKGGEQTAPHRKAAPYPRRLPPDCLFPTHTRCSNPALHTIAERKNCLCQHLQVLFFQHTFAAAIIQEVRPTFQWTRNVYRPGKDANTTVHHVSIYRKEVHVCSRNAMHESEKAKQDAHAHLQAASHSLPTGRVLAALDQVPDASADCSHAKGASNVPNNPVWTRLPAMVHSCAHMTCRRAQHQTLVLQALAPEQQAFSFEGAYISLSSLSGRASRDVESKIVNE